MSYDFYAEFIKEKRGDLENKLKEIKSNNKKSQWQEKAKEILPNYFLDNFSPNWYSKLKEMSLFIEFYGSSSTDNKKLMQAGYSGYILNRLKEDDVYRMAEDWVLKKGDTYKSNLFETIEKTKHNSRLPNSILFRIEFILKKPFIIQDDEDIYTDNPICKEKIFKVPYVRPSSFKGALRYASMRICFENIGELSDEEKTQKRLILYRLFGNEKENIKIYLDNLFGKDLQEDFQRMLKEDHDILNVKGRLNFYPTFFSQMHLDVIAPHDRETKTPVEERSPIPFEIVPECTRGEFILLYFPFDLIGDDKRLKEEVPCDLEILKEAIPAMLTKYGFGAKTTASYGVADITKIVINGKDCGTDWDKVLEEVKHVR